MASRSCGSDGQWRFAAAIAITQADHRTEFDQPQLVYNIEVAHAHTYFIGKWMWWVHNANVCVPKLVKDGKKVAAETVERLSEVRLGKRRIPDSEHKQLRGKTPNAKIKDKVNEKYVPGMADEALPGFKVEKRLHADHIVSMDQVTKMEGFDKLTEAQNLEVLNNSDNFIGLSEAANTSKGSKTYEAWQMHNKSGTPVDSVFRERMMKAEKETAKKLQTQIDNLANLNQTNRP